MATKLNVPGPTPEELPQVLSAFLADPLSTFTDLNARYGALFRLPIGGRDTVFLNDSDAAERVLRLDFSVFGMSTMTERLNEPLLGRSMPVTTDHGYWEELHSVIMPMFTPKMIKSYFEQTVKVVAEEVDQLVEYAREGRTVHMLDFVRHGIFVALTKTLFIRGVEPGDVDKLLELFAKSDKYMHMRYTQGETADSSDDPVIVAGREALKEIDEYIYSLIAFRRASCPPEPEDMLDVLLTMRTREGRLLDDKEVRDNAMALFFGGQETTPSVTTWAFALLSANPDKREKMLAEVDRVLEGRQPTWEDLRKLEYTEMVLEEAMRLYPPFAFIGRETLEDTELRGYQIPRGTPLGFVGWTIHRNPTDWPDPESFIPERHTRELQRSRNKCAFLAFSYGQRRCTGERVGRMEGVLLLSMLAQKVLLDRVGGGLSPHQVIMAIKPADGLPMTVTERAPNS